MAGAADGSATFAVGLDASGARAGAAAAAGGLRDLRARLKENQAALTETKRAMGLLAAGGKATKGEVEALRVKLATQKAEAAGLAKSYLAAGGKASELGKATKETTTIAERGRLALGAMGKAARVAAQGTSSLGGAASSAAGAMSAAAGSGAGLYVAIAMAAAALPALIGGLGALAVKLGDSRREELLHLEGLTKMRFWYGAVGGSAQELQSAIDRVSGSTAASRGQVSGLAESLYRAGVRGKNLSQALEAAAIVSTTQGEAMAQAFVGQAAGAAMAGASVAKLSETVKARLGPLAAKQALGLGVQMTKLREGLSALFRGLNIDPVLKGLSHVVSLFREGSAVSAGLSAILEAVFGPIFGKGEGAGLLVKRAIQGVVIGLLNLTIIALKARNWVRDIFPDDVLPKGAAVSAAVTAGKWAIYGFAAALLVAASPVIMITAGLGALAAAAYGAWQAIKAGWETVSGIDWSGLGASIVDGIVGGIKRGAGKALAAIRGLGADLKTAFKTTLGIASPSRAFKAEAVHIPGGVEAGVDAGAPRARAAVARMVGPGDMRIGGGGGGGARGGGPLVVIETLIVQAAGGAQSVGIAVRDEVIRYLEQAAIEVGAARGL